MSTMRKFMDTFFNRYFIYFAVVLSLIAHLAIFIFFPQLKRAQTDVEKKYRPIRLIEINDSVFGSDENPEAPPGGKKSEGRIRRIEKTVRDEFFTTYAKRPPRTKGISDAIKRELGRLDNAFGDDTGLESGGGSEDGALAPVPIRPVDTPPPTTEAKRTNEGPPVDVSKFYNKYQVDVLPKIVQRGVKEHPDYAQEKGIEAKVKIKVYFDETGDIVKIDKASAQCDQPGYGFEDAAVNYLNSSRFQPAMRDGRPVPVLVRMTVTFELER